MLGNQERVMKFSKLSSNSLVVGITQAAITGFLLWQKLHKHKEKKLIGHSFAGTTGDPAHARMEPEFAHSHDVRAVSHRAPAFASPPATHEPYWKALWHVAIAAAKAWSSHRASSKGAALALYTLFSLAPMLVLIVTIAGFFFGEDTVRASLVEQMSNLMGTQGADAIKTILAGGQHESSGVVASIVSAVLVLVSATTAFAELKDSLDELWEVPASSKSGFWSVIRERFLSFGLILVLALMLLASLAVSAALAALGNMWGGTGEDSPFRLVSLALSNIVSFAILTGLFAVIYKYLPAVKIAWKDVAVGAVLTAALFTIGKSLIGMYVAHADISSSYGAAGSVVILITWIFYSAQIFFYGSLFTHEYAMKLGSRVGNQDNHGK
jgi:membrane protein